VNEAEGLAAFKEVLERLVDSATRNMKPAAIDAYIAETDGPIEVQEATTRTQFLDDVLDALGWSRGVAGDLGEEVRLKGDTTVFVDYLGTARYLEPGKATPVPLLLVEAKAWGKPYIGQRPTTTPFTIEALLIAGVDHVRGGGVKAKSPLRSDWHEHLVQISTYVQRLAQIDGHKLRRVVLTSGDWLLIFDDAHEAFVKGNLSADQFVIMPVQDYVRRSNELYLKLSKACLGQEMPDWVTAAQAPNVMPGNKVAAAYLAAQMTHVQYGSGRVGQTPLISVVPHVILVDSAGRQLSVFANAPQSLELTGRNLDDHLNRTRETGLAVLADCAAALDVALTPSPLSDYPGLPQHWRQAPTFDAFIAPVQNQRAEWTVVTGDDGHFLLAAPLVEHCAFHRWDASHQAGHPAGTGAINMAAIEKPRTLFVDGDAHHCAHAGMLALRRKRCRISPFEQRLCCQACRFLDDCFPADERAAMPCGGVLSIPTPLVDPDEF